MGRTKSTPKRTDGPTGDTSTGEYLGLYGAAATNSLETNRLPGVRALEEDNVRATTEAGKTSEGSNEDPSSPGQESIGNVTIKKKAVAFAENLRTDVEAVRPPEVEIFTEFATSQQQNIRDDVDSERTACEENLGDVDHAENDRKLSILRYSYDPSRQGKQVEEDATNETDISLRTFRLDTNNIRLEVTNPTQNTSQLDSLPHGPPYQIYTAKGAAELVQFCLGLPHNNHSNLHKTENIALAVEQGFLRLTIECSPGTNLQQQQRQQQYEVTLALTHRAFETCRPTFLPVKSSQASKVYQAAVCLHRALAELYPKEKVFFPLASQARTQHAITAKEIYALVDNVQLKASLGKKKQMGATGDAASDSTGALKIPGLVPTLRPYQEEAVRWMLAQERGGMAHASTNKSEEWELAWVVVHSYSGKMPEPSDKPRVVFLPEYMQHYPERIRQQKDSNRFFFCPFTCWLASTLEEAKAMTLTVEGAVSTRNTRNASDQFCGGILADSMGLGKTCELLACILANPDPERQHSLQVENLVHVVSSSSSSSSLSSGVSSAASAVIADPGEIFEPQNDQDDGSNKRSRSSVLVIRNGNASIKRGHSSFVDGSTSSLDQGLQSSESSNQINSTNLQQNCDAKILPDDDQIVPMSDSEQGASSEELLNLEETWIDIEERELGACICGKVISIFPSPPTDSVVICTKCRDPMHWDCAAYKSERGQLSQMSKSVLFRMRFSGDMFACKLCPETFCPCCVADRASKKAGQGADAKTRSRATVIVTPPAILSQWEREIQRHSRTADESNHLRVVKYPGVRNLLRDGKRKDDSFSLLHPRWLADADIVLVTFDALRHDLGHSDSNPFAAGAGRASLRKRKRYRVVPSPLSSISWWRVCLDEAQRIETPTAGSAQMTLKLDAHFRWAVSGTPIGRGKLEDLFGLLLFLQVTTPFNDKDWFRKCFASSANDSYLGQRLRHLLGRVCWRSTKALDIVAVQMGVPPQVEQTNVLKFSSVEKHFYNRQLETTLEIASDISQQQKGGLKARKRTGGNSCLEVLARQLHKLRAACCHPQVGSHGLAKKNRVGSSDGMKVLSMAEVLDRLIDDAKNQCEEALRVVLFHTNPLAAISRLKVEARNVHQIAVIKESDEFLCAQSCKLYQDALDLADENGAPSLVIGDALLSGNRGFRFSQKHVRGGKALLEWHIQRDAQSEESAHSDECRVWANFDFHGQAKKMCQIRLRAVETLPEDLHADGPSSISWNVRFPRECVLQVSNAAVGGEYVDILSFSLPVPSIGGSTENNWIVHGGFWIYRSKIWRLVVKSFHHSASLRRVPEDEPNINLTCAKGDYVGIEVELFEPTIGSDSLQRLHTLHNSVISFQELQSVRSSTTLDNEANLSSQERKLPLELSSIEIEQRILAMEQDVARIEQYHLEYAKTIRSECQRQLVVSNSNREYLECELFDVSKPHKGAKPQGFWDVAWWEDALVAVRLNGTPAEQLSLCEKVTEAIGDCSGNSKAFPVFEDLQGLHVALKLRLEDSLSQVGNGQYNNCIQSVLKMSPNPTEGELLENKICQVCKADWSQTGPKCRHCIVGDNLKAIDIDKQKLERAILDAIWKWSKAKRSGVQNSATLKGVTKVATKFFEVCEAARKEVLAASRLWRVHLDLLNVIDELNSCKTSMRLVHEGEDVSALTEEQKGSVIVPIDICSRYHEHAAKQAMALANLRRHKHTLIFLKNQVSEQEDTDTTTGTKDSEDTCMVCLSAFDSDRAVLACGHSFHMTPCVEKLKKSSGGSRLISCPLRCTVRTRYEDILIASNKRRDDGSQSKRKVKGSWGTKVTAIVSDLLAVSDLGEKSIVFSMWEDMLDILGEALNANGLGFARASSLTRIGEATKTFRSTDCFVLLLNVKNGAEGLNLIEATHVFMIEPLLNCGLDSQATARIHRIGQARKTYLHRYLIEDTIEIKVDKYRKQHQEEQLEDAIMDSRKCAIQAGGIDGGFSSKEELLDMLSL